jgi:2-polyprenyl-3-methyl-5-hydroxy-6-metoxy-1,4-benzoquinol methylase
MKGIRRIKNRVLLKKRQYDDLKEIKLDPVHYSVVLQPASQLTYQYMADLIHEVVTVRLKRNPSVISVLDWGAGKGHVSYFLNKRGFKNITLAEVEGYPNTALWEKMNAKKVYLQKEDKLPIASKTYDIVISAGVLEHVPHDQASLGELQRVLKDDGLLFCFNLPARSGFIHQLSKILGDNYHDRLYSKKEIKFLLKRTGLKPLIMYRRQLLPKKKFNYKNPIKMDRLDSILGALPLVSLGAASLEFIAENQNCHIQKG